MVEGSLKKSSSAVDEDRLKSDVGLEHVLACTRYKYLKPNAESIQYEANECGSHGEMGARRREGLKVIECVQAEVDLGCHRKHVGSRWHMIYCSCTKIGVANAHLC